MLTAYEKPISSICSTNIIFSFSILFFVIVVISTLFIHVSNTKAIEIYIKNEKESQRDFQLKSWIYINYVAFSLGVEFAYVNIFEDQEVFQNLPAFADWPTFPQIYFNSELVGGGDIIVEMAKMGTLKGEMEKASEKFDVK